MQGISHVLERINAIQQKFSTPVASSTDNFSTVLAGVQNNTSVSDNDLPSDDISKMVQRTAAKYGVDSKLALAVAKVESNLSPDVVSSAGAVGVMQLMPETARELGVHNSKDPQENIDGGVRYLKELMTTFNGDAAKAVAAYNAGPQAVKAYNGTPPYSETQNYVAKVMAQYK